jgi:DNA repair exonuclease SbcCD ATPase subunit
MRLEEIERKKELKRKREVIQQEMEETARRMEEIERRMEALRRMIGERDEESRRTKKELEQMLNEEIQLRALVWNAELEKISQEVEAAKSRADKAWMAAGGMNQHVRSLGSQVTQQIWTLMELLTSMRPFYEAHEDVESVYGFLTGEDEWAAVWEVIPPLETAIVAVLADGGRDDGFMRANIDKMLLMLELTLDIMGSW